MKTIPDKHKTLATALKALQIARNAENEAPRGTSKKEFIRLCKAHDKAFETYMNAHIAFCLSIKKENT